MSNDQNIERAARIIAAAVVHGTTTDPAYEAARQLDKQGLLATAPADPFETPGRNRPVPSPAAVAMARQCRLAREAADRVEAVAEGMPGRREVTAAGGEVQLVVHPQSLSDWFQWLRAVGASDARGTSVGTAMVVRCQFGGVRMRLVGYGVPAMFSALPFGVRRRTAVRP
ncbi:hypothetical protein AB0D60_03095 [Streptomyces sp. NPDC048306]|uniref:hypothetical protein n=1 Tax=Streptomyces sp. NPDC048306 TaxID=3154502 RepID=UPI0033C96B2C